MNPHIHHQPANGYHSNNRASSSSNPYPDFSHLNQPAYSNTMPILHHQQQQYPPQAQSMHQMHQNQWPSGIRPSPHAPHQVSQHRHFSHSGWSDGQVHPQSYTNGNQAYPNGANGMGGINVPFISQQVLQDAFAMSAPVEATDEKILLQALLDSRSRRESYKDALNGLHGKNGHSASLWKDYYLDHKDRLDEWITVYLNPPKMVLQTAKKPSPSSYKTEVESSPVIPPRALPKRQKKPEQPSRPLPASGGRRSTINSLTAPAPVFGDHLPAPNAEIKIPEPPSRSPSPPTIVIPHRGRGNKYTPEDREFFLKFISWRLKGDPTLTRHDLCEQLAEKAPHHTAQSWASHWSNRHDIPDKILAAAKGDDYDEDEETGSEEEMVHVRRRPKYRDLSSDEDDEDEDADASDQAEEEEEEEEEDSEPIQSWSESDMGPKGSPFTEADLYITARYVASFPNFDEISSKEKWQPYNERFSQRSAKSWAEYYRRNEQEISRLARKIRKQGIHTQRALPAWASTPDSVELKRKHSTEDGSDDVTSRSKRGRGGEGDA